MTRIRQVELRPKYRYTFFFDAGAFSRGYQHQFPVSNRNDANWNWRQKEVSEGFLYHWKTL